MKNEKPETVEAGEARYACKEALIDRLLAETEVDFRCCSGCHHIAVEGTTE